MAGYEEDGMVGIMVREVRPRRRRKDDSGGKIFIVFKQHVIKTYHIWQEGRVWRAVKKKTNVI
jgi:hypothetical protein